MMRCAIAVALGAALVRIGTPTFAKTAVDCQHEYMAKRAAGETTGQRKRDFVKECLPGRSPATGPAPAEGSPVATTNSGSGAAAQNPVPGLATNDYVSKESENPVTRWITLPLRYEPEFFDGPYKLTKETFEIDQAVVPFKLNDDWALITRTKLPLVVQPPKSAGADWATGLSNGYTTFFLSPARGEGFYWGAGPVLYYPATNTAVGVNKWGSGPSLAFVVKNEGPWVFGAVANNIWSFGGGPTGDRTNQLLLNPFISYHLGGRMGCQLLAGYYGQLDCQRGQVDRPGRRRLQQGDKDRRSVLKVGLGRLLQRGAARAGAVI